VKKIETSFLLATQKTLKPKTIINSCFSQVVMYKKPRSNN